MSDGEPGFSLRAADDRDRDFLLALFVAGRGPELALMPLAEPQRSALVEQQFAAQSAHYASAYPGAEFELVIVGGRPTGRLAVDRGAAVITIIDISLLPEHRGRGIGTTILRSLAGEADAAALPMRLHVERSNRARGLYERLGFVTVTDDGVYTLMERAPATGGP